MTDNREVASLFSSLDSDDPFSELSVPKLYAPLPASIPGTLLSTRSSNNDVSFHNESFPSQPQPRLMTHPTISNFSTHEQFYQLTSPPLQSITTHQRQQQTHSMIPTTHKHIREDIQTSAVPFFAPGRDNDSFLTGPMIQTSLKPQNILESSSTAFSVNSQQQSNTLQGPPDATISSHKLPNIHSLPSDSLLDPLHSDQTPSNYDISPFPTMAAKTLENSIVPTSPVTPHWFYLTDRTTWRPFSFLDSRNLEIAYHGHSNSKKLSTDGGRFDVDLSSMRKVAVYWDEAPCEVRRCTWFFKHEADNKFVPYETTIAERLEAEYMSMMAKGIYNIRVDISSGVFVVFHNPNVLVQHTSNVDNVDWTGEDSKVRPKVVKRGVAELQEDIDQGEALQIDHLVFVVHGIGPVADLRMRSIVECVEDFRKNSLNLVTTHQSELNRKNINRVEFLPIQWYSCLRADRYGIDKQLKSLSLPSISKLRNFTNETLTDILFFTSPMYCQTICDTVVGEMNRLYKLFISRNPQYNGSVSVVGHSLGSCILFDILANQTDGNASPTMTQNENVFYEDVGDVVEESVASNNINLQPASSVSPSMNEPLPHINELLSKLNLSSLQQLFEDEQIDTETLVMCSEPDLRDLGVPFGPRKKLSLYIKQLSKSGAPLGTSTPSNNSPRPTDLLTRGTQTLVRENENTRVDNTQCSYMKSLNGTGQPLVAYAKLEFQTDCLYCLGSPIGLFLTCRGVASIGLNFKLPKCPKFMNIFHPYDPVVYRLEPLISDEIDIPPVLIPHHKGRKRFHLEIRENLSRVGANLKSGLMDAVNKTWSSINDFARAHRSTNEDPAIANNQAHDSSSSVDPTQESVSFEEQELAKKERSLNFGLLNGGQRIDFVLQEKPFEILNEYLFALSSHTCYWTSEDTALLILKEIYKIKK